MDDTLFKDRLKLYDIDSCGIDDSLFGFLVNTKLATNLRCIRDKMVQKQLNNQCENHLDRYQREFANLEANTLFSLNKLARNLKEQNKPSTESTKIKRYSIDFDSLSSDELLDITKDNERKINEDESLAQLRKRLLKNEKNNDLQSRDEITSVNKQIQVEEGLQKELIHDMSQLVIGLRKGAEAFQNALDEDSTVLKATEIGLQVTSKNLSSLGGKLKKYHNTKLGFFFYLWCFLFLFFGLILTYIIIKIFPKM